MRRTAATCREGFPCGIALAADDCGFERAAGAPPKGGVSAKQPGVSGIRESTAEG